MARAVVTGAGGFIGSHLVDTLLRLGNTVVGIDTMEPRDGPATKQMNLREALKSRAFRLARLDITTASDDDLMAALDGADWIFHLAGQPGVRQSWGPGFVRYTRGNVEATQRLLELSRHLRLQRFVLASTSSVYGGRRLPMRESDPAAPVSPYGLTKLAAEHLCRIYSQQWGVPTVIVRYFTVYGPRQRPDMAFSQFIANARASRPIILYAHGRLQRDFTFVSDAVSGTLLAATYGQVGEVYNIGSGRRHTLRDVVRTLEQVLGQPLVLTLKAETPQGDMSGTLADITKARTHLRYQPQVELADGLLRQVQWFDAIRVP